MLPNAKAVELVNKYKSYVTILNDSPFTGNTYSDQEIFEKAKKIALYVVGEIRADIRRGYEFDWVSERQGGDNYEEYWYYVTIEIKKLTPPLSSVREGESSLKIPPL